MAKDDEAVKFTRPEDDPELFRLVEALKKDSPDGDPFHVDLRKRGAPPRVPAKAIAPEAPVVTALRANEAASHRAPSRLRWMPFLGLAIVGPAVVLALALLLARTKAPIVAVPPGPSVATPGAPRALDAPSIATVALQASDAGTPSPSASPPVPTVEATAPGPSSTGKARPRSKAGRAADAGPGEPAIAPDFVQ